LSSPTASVAPHTDSAMGGGRLGSRDPPRLGACQPCRGEVSEDGEAIPEAGPLLNTHHAHYVDDSETLVLTDLREDQAACQRERDRSAGHGDCSRHTNPIGTRPSTMRLANGGCTCNSSARAVPVIGPCSASTHNIRAAAGSARGTPAGTRASVVRCHRTTAERDRSNTAVSDSLGALRLSGDSPILRPSHPGSSCQDVAVSCGHAYN
jgi:hypothetical protein